MLLTRRYKYVLVCGLIIRIVGYGVMVRLRGASNSMAELFVVQIIQGTGSGVVQTIVLVIAQIVVPHTELAPATALVLLFVYLGNAIGSAVAGSIYTNSFAGLIRRYLGGSNVNQALVDRIMNTLETDVVSQGFQKNAVNHAVSSGPTCGRGSYAVVEARLTPDLVLRGDALHDLRCTRGFSGTVPDGYAASKLEAERQTQPL